MRVLPFFVSKCTMSAPLMKVTVKTLAVTAKSLESPEVGFEPTTNGLTVHCSTAELFRNEELER